VIKIGKTTLVVIDEPLQQPGELPPLLRWPAGEHPGNRLVAPRSVLREPDQRHPDVVGDLDVIVALEDSDVLTASFLLGSTK
jgi:hypothetical protein